MKTGLFGKEPGEGGGKVVPRTLRECVLRGGKVLWDLGKEYVKKKEFSGKRGTHIK